MCSDNSALARTLTAEHGWCDICHVAHGRYWTDYYWTCGKCRSVYLNGAIERESVRSMDIDQKLRGLGGTDIAAIFGIDKYKSAHDVWRRLKFGVENSNSNFRMRLGKALEPFLAEEYTGMTDRQIRLHDRTVQSEYHPRLFVTPDAMCINERRGVEFKTASGYEAHPQTSYDLPESWQLQVQTYMLAFEIPLWDVFVAWGFGEASCYEVKRDWEAGVVITQHVAEFYDRYIDGNEEPPLEPTEATKHWLRQKYPAHREPPRLASPDEAAMLDYYAQVWLEARQVAHEKEELETRIKACIKDAEGLEWERGRFLYRKVKDTTKVDWKGLAGHLLNRYRLEERLLLEEQYSRVQEGTRRMDFRLNVKEAAGHDR